MLLLIGPHKLAVCAAVGFILLQTHNKQTFGPAARLPLSDFTLAQQQLDIAVAAGENKIDFTALLFFLFVRLFMSRAAKRTTVEVFI
jgi:hypothetical protein